MPPKILRVQQEASGPELVRALDLDPRGPLLVVMGGAARLSEEDAGRVAAHIVGGIAGAAMEVGAVVVDGGTSVGVMALLDAGLEDAGHSGPHIGVLPSGKLRPKGTGDDPIWSVGSHHTHLVLVEGEAFGEETQAMYALVEALAYERASVAILVGGGPIARRELELNFAQDREVIVLVGSGSLADQISRATLEPGTSSDSQLHALFKEGRVSPFDLAKPPEDLRVLIRQRWEAT